MHSINIGTLLTCVVVVAVSWPHCSHRFSLTSGASVCSTSCWIDTELDRDASAREESIKDCPDIGSTTNVVNVHHLLTISSSSFKTPHTGTLFT